MPISTKRTARIPLLIAAGVSALFLGLAGNADAATKIVKLNSSEIFAPTTITIHIGDSVTWKNGSTAVHTVTDDPQLAASSKDSVLPAGAKSFNSGFLKAGQNFTHKFNVAGTYRYFCILHESAGMVGTVIVKGK